MSNIILTATIGALALFGWGWLSRFFHFLAPQTPAQKVEQQLKSEGVLKADGTISVDKDFDAEFNAQLKEMNSIDSDTDTELDTLEKEQ